MNSSSVSPEPFALYKGCTRPAMILNVPLIPLMIMVMIVASIAMLLSLWWWFLALPLWFGMAQITRWDDQAFRLYGLWLDTKLRNRYKTFWQASSYTPTDYRRRR